MKQAVCFRCEKLIDLNCCVMVVDAAHPVGIAAHLECVTPDDEFRKIGTATLEGLPAQALTGYICGVAWSCEMEEPRMLGDCRISPNADYAKRAWKCTEECGLAEVELRFVRWIVEPQFRMIAKPDTQEAI